jgi:2-dehydro-3-deoxyphosphogluconate aldolase / (4S)-4-hydroxy-2-oxoglutarate aldolase
VLTIVDILNQNRIIPVIVIDKAEHAIPLANILFSSGFTVLEITLRTNAALTAIKQIRTALPQAIVGAGTIINFQQLSQAREAGAQFAVSPGLSKHLVLAAQQEKLAYLPGVATVSEALLAYELDITHVKFFPAENLGGIKILSAIAEVLPLHFCPTGGITRDNFLNYLAISQVSSVGGTWLAPRLLIQNGDFDEISFRVNETKKILAALN